MQISEQTVLITGGGRGLGHAIVRAFAQQGARVVINYLRSRDPAWGLRELDAVAALGAANGFSAPAIVEMPANNLSVIFRKM